MIKLPDLGIGYRLADEIHKLSLELAKKKLEINAMKSAIVNKVLNDSTYWKNSKPPSMSLMEKTFLVTGIDNIDLLKLYKEKEELQAELDYKKIQLDLFKLEVEVWRTQSANERSAVT